MAVLGVRDSFKMVDKMAAILDFAKKLYFLGKMRKSQMIFARVVQYDTFKHFSAFGSIHTFFTLILMTSYLVAIATDCCQT